MELEALVLIDDDKDAQRLVVTWPVIGTRQYDDDQSRFEDWSRVSGVYPDDIAKLEPILFQAEILGPEGFVAADALRFIRGKIAARLPAARTP